MRNQIRIFWTAVMFYSRLPVPNGIDHNATDLNKATRYLPLIGVIVGLAGISALVLGEYLLFREVGIVLAMATTVYITGAFHEDGFMDVCDGFGGGWSKDQKLTIMKDSRVGSYGVVGMILMLLLKFILLKNIEWPLLILAYLISHVLSRLVPVWIIQFSTYVRDDQKEKAKPVATKVSFNNFIVANIIAAVLSLTMGLQGLYLITLTPILYLISSWYFKKHLGGYTGDCLGAAQQMSELAFYILFTILWKFGLFATPQWM